MRSELLTTWSGLIVVKKFGLYLIAICLLPVSMVNAGTVEDAIAERIKKVGTVCVEGADCAAASSGGMVVAAAGGGASGESIYKKSCATCHAIGIAGAPKFGDIAAWAPRIAKGMDVLYASSINGLPPGMPAKGLCFTCSDDDLKAVVDYMVNGSK